MNWFRMYLTFLEFNNKKNNFLLFIFNNSLWLRQDSNQGSSSQDSRALQLLSYISASKVIREKSRGEGSLIVQDTIENVSEPNIFF